MPSIPDQHSKIFSKVVLLFGLFFIANFIVLYIDLPLPRHVGIDLNRRLSPTNYIIDILFWSSIFYLLYLLLKPLVHIFNSQLLGLILTLTLLLTSLTLLFESPYRLSWSSGSTIWLKKYEIEDYKANSRVDVFKGLPLNYYHHWTGYDKEGTIVWDYIALDGDNILFDILFWTLISMIVLRLAYYKRLD